jgi:shikimate kinase
MRRRVSGHDEMTERILLIGMMGVGKSTVGRALATRLGWLYLDSDEEVLAATGRTVKQISEEDGVDRLHQFEDEALVAALQSPTSAVIGVAGGALLVEANRELLKGAQHVVWLRASLETLAARIGTKGDRPYFDDDPARTIRELYEVRRPLYAEVATVTIDVDESAPEEIVETILATLQ